MALIEIIANDRLGQKVRVKCDSDDTVGDLKKLIAAQTGTDPSKVILKKWYTIYKDHITLSDCQFPFFRCDHSPLLLTAHNSFPFTDEIHDGMSLEMQ